MRYERFSSAQRAVAAFLIAISTLFFNSTLPGTASGAPAPNPAALEESPVAEYVRTFAYDCVTPRTVFSPGETVCAEAGGMPGQLTYRHRRFQWAAPDGFVADQTNIKADPQYDKFVIPTSGQFAQLGTWVVATINVDAELYAAAKFTVRNPRLPYANLTISKVGPNWVNPEDTVSYQLWIGNSGPDFAEGIEFIDEVPTNMVFVALKQASGALVECSTPARGETGRIYCKAKGLKMDETIELYAYYQVNPDLREGTVCTSSSEISSYTSELKKEDNVVTTEITVGYPGFETEPPPDGE